MRFTSMLGVLGALSSLHAHIRSAEPFHGPTRAHAFASATDKYLHVVWSLPEDLGPFADLETHEEVEAFIARTALLLHREHRALEPTRSKPCKVQVVRLSGDHGFTTVAEVVLPQAAETDEAIQRALGLELPALKASFASFVVEHARIRRA